MTKATPNGPLHKRIKELETGEQVSGGQYQRLAISRTFMRSMGSSDVKLLVYDEPSSALDPKAEFGTLTTLKPVNP